MNQIITESPSTNSESAVLAITSTGHIFPVQSVLSSYLSADLLILSIAASPLRDPKYASAPSKTLPRLKTLPISPYPCRTGSPVGCFVYTAPTIARQWQLGRVVEYKDLNGRSVEVRLSLSLSPQRHSLVLPLTLRVFGIEWNL